MSTVARIHEALAIAPIAPKVTQSTAAVESEPETGGSEVVGAQAEIPFIPASQRQEGAQDALEGPVKDSIVMVGQASRKKRKRTKGESASNKSTKEEDGSAEPFDYSTVSNILDEGSDHEPEAAGSMRKRKQRTQGKGVFMVWRE